MATGLENLIIYNLAELLEIDVHKLTNSFPQDEKYRSINQIKRSSASVCNNIAESYNKQTNKQKLQYLYIAKAEAEETKRNLIRSTKKGFVPTNKTNETIDKYTELLKAISGYIKFIKNKQ